MLYFNSVAHDPSTDILTVRYRSASGDAWAAYEYRDVSRRLYQRILDARPQGQQVIDAEVAPSHEVRRRGESGWRSVPVDPDLLRAVRV